MRYNISDAPFQRLALIFLVCFLLVGLGAGYWSVIRAESLYQNLDYSRQIQHDLAIDRGRIFAADGSVLVETVFDAEGRAQRVYRYPPLSAVTGHWTTLLGKTGLEGAYDDFLSGARGQQGLHVFDELMHEQIVGADLVTTIQPRLQQRADELLGTRAGAVVVLEPRTGAILALASHPSYDPNTYLDNADALVTDRSQPTLNRVTRGLYTPGSVFKVVTLAGALAQSKTTLSERFRNDNGIHIVEGFPVRDGSDLPQRNAPYDLAHALAWSSNVTFAQLGERLGPDGMRQIARDFGFGEEPPFDMPTEASQIGSDASLLDQVGLAVTAFGQGELLVTPLQMALVAAAVVNDGIILEPRLVTTIRSRDGQPIASFPPRPWKQALSSGVAAQVRETMIISAAEGFARAGAPQGIPIGGKTGTAQLGGSAEPHAWFMAFAPANDPQIVVIVMVENGGAGGDVAAPIARDLIGLAFTP